MRYKTHSLLSDYALGRLSLLEVRDFIEDVDWDDPVIPEDERTLLLGVEARLIGIDEGFNDESDLKAFLASLIPLLVSWLGAPSIPFILARANNISAPHMGLESSHTGEYPDASFVRIEVGSPP